MDLNQQNQEGLQQIPQANDSNKVKQKFSEYAKLQMLLFDKQPEIGEQEINEEKTQSLQNCAKFTRFKEWCFSNGLKINPAISTPVAFGSLGILGVAAKNNIEANTIIAAIPSRLTITLQKVKESELAFIFNDKENGTIFNRNESKGGDCEFNILATFIIYEKLKGDKSFFQPYFDIIPRSYTMYDWTAEEVAQTESPELIEEFPYYLQDIKQTCSNLKNCLIKYPSHFKESDLTQEIIMWSYELIITRLFGFQLPSTCLVPFGDLFNHGSNCCTHYIVNTRLEREEPVNHKYKIKKHKIDLAVLDQSSEEDRENQEKMQGNPIQKEEYQNQIEKGEGYNTKLNAAKIKQKKLSHRSQNGKYEYKSMRLIEVKKNIPLISQQDQKKENWQKCKFKEDEALRETFYTLRFEQLQKDDKLKELWEYEYFTTSVTEDNDTDDEQTQFRNSQFHELFEQEIKEIQSMRNPSKHPPIKETLDEKKRRIFQPTNIKNTNDLIEKEKVPISQNKQDDQTPNEKEKNQGSSNEEEEKDEGKEEEEEEEEDNKEDDNDEDDGEQVYDKNKKEQEGVEKKAIGQDIIAGNLSTLNSMSISTFLNENAGKTNDGDEEDTDSTLSQESDWSWYQEDDKDSYFTVVSEKPIQMGKQIYLFYGSRTNKFLLQQYGFTFQNNQFDSFGFMIWNKPEEINFNEEGIEEIIILKKFICQEDQKKQYLIHRGQQIKTTDLSMEFRLKRNHLCEEVVVFLRIFLSGQKVENYVLFTLPLDLNYEIYVFEFFQKILHYLQKKYTTIIEEDEQILKDQSINYKLRFAVIMRLEHKKILKEQLEIVSQILLILNELKRINSQFKQNQIQSNDEGKEEGGQQIEKKKSSYQKLPLFFKDLYMTNFEGFPTSSELLIQRHKIKNYLFHLHIGIQRSEHLSS